MSKRILSIVLHICVVGAAVLFAFMLQIVHTVHMLDTGGIEHHLYVFTRRHYEPDCLGHFVKYNILSADTVLAIQ
jgi:hypothetical protein